VAYALQNSEQLKMRKKMGCFIMFTALASSSPQKSKKDYDPKIVKKLEECISVQYRLSKQRQLYHPIIEQVKSGFGIIPIKISYFKYDAQLHQWIDGTCERIVEEYLKLAIIQFAESLDTRINNLKFEVRLNTK
jgi:hypothetical protein